MKRQRKGNNWQKGTSILLAGIMVATMAGCGSTSSQTASGTDATQQTEASAAESKDEAAPVADTSKETAQSSGKRYDKITVALGSDPADLGPTGYGDISAQYVLPNIWEALFDFRDNEYVPILAKGYTEVDDTHWDVELYDYIKDSAGNAITADDVVFSYKTLMDSGKAAKWDTFSDITVIANLK